MGRLCVLLLVAAWPGPSADESADPGETAATVLEFARSNLGETIGDGACSSLVVAALAHAGALPRSGAEGWGEPIEDLKDARPGDVLEFRDARFAGRQVNPNRTITAWSYEFPHHLAIVSAARTRRGSVLFRVIHQNARIKGRDESDAVKEWTVDMAALKGGTVRAYRAVPGGRRSEPETPAPDTDTDTGGR